MFKKLTPEENPAADIPSVERIGSVLGPDILWQGDLKGSGGVRIDGAFEGKIGIDGLLVIGPSGRVTCDNIRARKVVVAGAVRGNITAEKMEIRATGRVWGDVVTTSFITEDGAFLRGQIRMEDEIILNFDESEAADDAAD